MRRTETDSFRRQECLVLVNLKPRRPLASSLGPARVVARANEVIEQVLKVNLVLGSGKPPNNTFEQTAGSRTLAAAAQRGRYADRRP